jgi:hypothetical protein
MQHIVADDFIERRQARRGNIADVHVFASVRHRGAQVAIDPLITHAHAAAETLLVPVAKPPIEVRATEAKTHRPVQPVGILPAHEITIHLGARRGVDAEPLTVAAECRAVADVFPTCREARPVEVALVNRDVADDARIGVDADAKHQATGLRLLSLDDDVDQTLRILRNQFGWAGVVRAEGVNRVARERT